MFHRSQLHLIRWVGVYPWALIGLGLCLVWLALLWPMTALGAPAAQSDAGDLGDIGYYYSQAGPFVDSTVSVFNPGEETATAQLTLRNDVGILVYTQTQTIAAGAQWHFSPAAAGLHGIFHGEVRSDDADLAVFVSSRDGANGAMAQPDAWHSGYVAARPADVGVRLSLGEVTGDVEIGDVESGDVEIVVQNLAERSNQVIFTLCPEDGRCFANNVATLPAHGRRSFLLSQLAHSNRYGDGLVALQGVFEVTVSGEWDRSLAALVHVFEPRAAQQAELGVVSLTQSLAQVTLSAAETSAPVGHGTIPRGEEGLYLPNVMRSYMPPSARRCALPGGEGDWACGAQQSAIWHLPFVAAPNVAFEDTSSKLGVGYPWQGIQETGRTLDDWPEMADLNWYNWMANANWNKNFNDTLWTLCESDAHYFPMYWFAPVERNTVPSSCAGRPLLLVNEPVLLRQMMTDAGENLDSWSDDAVADNLFRHRTWPGDLYCCGHVSWPADNLDKISANATSYATFGNILDAYQQRFNAPLPIDGVHLHFYLWSVHMDMAAQAPKPIAASLMRNSVREWLAVIEENFGADFPVIVSEYGVLHQGDNHQAARDVVKAGLDDLTNLLIEELGDNLVRLHYFQFYWGGDRDPNRPMWLVGSDDGAYALDEINDVGALFLELAGAE